jgi:hypothetical protein
MKTVIVRSDTTDRFKLHIPTSYNDLTDLPVIPPEYTPPSLLCVVYHSRIINTIEGPATDTLNYDLIEYDPGGYVTTGSSWKFTVPAGNTGLYLCTAYMEVEFDAANVDCDLVLECWVAGALVGQTRYAFTHAAGGSVTLAHTQVVSLTAGQEVTFKVTNNNADLTSVVTVGDELTNAVSITRLR